MPIGDPRGYGATYLARAKASVAGGDRALDGHVLSRLLGRLDISGLHRLYISGRYGITAAMMTPLANTFCDTMTKSATYFAGKVDGTDGSGNSARTTYIRAGWLLLAEFRTTGTTS